MTYKKSDFTRFPSDAEQVLANLEAAYEQSRDARQTLDELPSSVFWQAQNDTEYLTVKGPGNRTSSKGRRSPETEKIYEAYLEEREAAKRSLATAESLIDARARQFRALRLPSMPNKQAELLRAIDAAQLLRNDLLVVGTNAFAAYEVLCRARFPAGNEATEDFDLAWCRGSGASLASLFPDRADEHRKSLLAVLRTVDKSYTINPRKPYQAKNDDGYEVELLAAPSRAPLPTSEAFEPMVSLVEQEWLLKGRPVFTVVATPSFKACPLYAPDPRWMAVHKLWLSRKPERNANKKPKDARQGLVLLDACRYFLADSYPMDLDFILDLPPELRDLFNEWAEAADFTPPGAYS